MLRVRLLITFQEVVSISSGVRLLTTFCNFGSVRFVKFPVGGFGENVGVRCASNLKAGFGGVGQRGDWILFSLISGGWIENFISNCIHCIVYCGSMFHSIMLGAAINDLLLLYQFYYLLLTSFKVIYSLE